MGAIAVSAADEERIARLVERVGVRSKAAVVRIALDELERVMARRELATAVRDYVRRHGDLDRRENAMIAGGWAVHEDE